MAAHAPPIGPRRGQDVQTLRAAWRAFTRFRSPRLIGASIATTGVARLLLGRPDWRDVAAAGGIVAVYPFGEWAIHVYLLHLPPITLGARQIELPTAAAHREHHEEPNDLGLILLGPDEALALLFGAVPAVVGAAAAIATKVGAAPSKRSLMTALVMGQALVGIYEWTHFVIHTGHRPKTRAFRAIWRNHRLHHFKNEHYWHGITSTIGDHVLGTAPDHRDVERSATARTLRG